MAALGTITLECPYCSLTLDADVTPIASITIGGIRKVRMKVDVIEMQMHVMTEHPDETSWLYDGE